MNTDTNTNITVVPAYVPPPRDFPAPPMDEAWVDAPWLQEALAEADPLLKSALVYRYSDLRAARSVVDATRAWARALSESEKAAVQFAASTHLEAAYMLAEGAEPNADATALLRVRDDLAALAELLSCARLGLPLARGLLTLDEQLGASPTLSVHGLDEALQLRLRESNRLDPDAWWTQQ